jgi:hypothetical protein
MGIPLRKWTRRMERLAAWLLIPLLLLQFLSGYAMIDWKLFGGILGRLSAFRIHSIIQPITMAAFVIHGFPWVRRKLACRGIRSPLIDITLAIIGPGLIAFAVYLHLEG